MMLISSQTMNCNKCTTKILLVDSYCDHIVQIHNSDFSLIIQPVILEIWSYSDIYQQQMIYSSTSVLGSVIDTSAELKVLFEWPGCRPVNLCSIIQ